jgi:hypothetical protein
MRKYYFRTLSSLQICCGVLLFVDVKFKIWWNYLWLTKLTRCSNTYKLNWNRVKFTSWIETTSSLQVELKSRQVYMFNWNRVKFTSWIETASSLQVELKPRQVYKFNWNRVKFTSLIETASSLPWCSFFAFHWLWMAAVQPNLLGFSVVVKDTNVFAIYVIFAVVGLALK